MILAKIEELKKVLTNEYIIVEKMVTMSIDMLIGKNSQQLNNIMKHEEEVNSSEIDIEEFCTSLIALYQPEAKNLRTILMILKINNDLERIADHAVTIAKSTSFLIEFPHHHSALPLLAEIAQEAEKMLSDSIRSFMDADASLAIEVCENDNRVDTLNEKIFRYVIENITPERVAAETAFHINRISQSFERIGDLSTNIAEDTIFMAEGTIIKHHQKE
jgi:phosphate transport system protein